MYFTRAEIPELYDILRKLDGNTCLKWAGTNNHLTIGIPYPKLNEGIKFIGVVPEKKWLQFYATTGGGVLLEPEEFIKRATTDFKKPSRRV